MTETEWFMEGRFKMKIRKKTLTLMSVFAVCLLLSVFTLAADSSYNSSNDPLVSKSYLDARISELNGTISQLNNDLKSLKTEITSLKSTVDPLKTQVNSLKSEVDSLKKQVEELKALVKDLGSSSGGSTGGNGDVSYVVIELNKGQTVYAKNGTVELIVRTGSATVVSPFTSGSTKQGLADNTTGKELYNGTLVPLNDLLLIPRGGDGRGIKITSNSTFVMIRGDYEIK